MPHKTLHPPGKGLFFAGLTLALVLAGAATYHYCFMQRQASASLIVTPPPDRTRLLEQDAKASRFFDEARRNVPAAVEQLSGFRNTLHLTYLMVKDKITGTTEASDYVGDVLRSTVLDPCAKAVQSYDLDFNSEGLQEQMAAICGDNSTRVLYAGGALGIEGLTLRSTLAAIGNTLSAVISRLSAAWGGAAGSAVADGPFPFGDMLGGILAAGGTIWSISELQAASEELPGVLTDTLNSSIDACQSACRKEVGL